MAGLLYCFICCFPALLGVVALAAFAMASAPQSLRLGMLPWTGVALARILLFGGLFGLLSVVLAALGKLRFLFLFWTLAVASVLLNNLLFSSYRFPLREKWRVSRCTWFWPPGWPPFSARFS